MNIHRTRIIPSIEALPSSRESSVGSEPWSVFTTDSRSSIASRPSLAQKSPMADPEWPTMSCNKCQKQIDSTVFLCSCKCMFCEDCTYSHFQTSESCPQCGFRVTADDFTEIMISDPSGGINDQYQFIESLFTKTSEDEPGEPITFNEMCTALMKEHDDILDNTKLFVKQFLVETQRTLQEARISKNQAQAYQKQLSIAKQNAMNIRTQYEDCKNQIHEKDRQIQQLKTMLARANGTKSQHREFTKQMQEKDRQIQHLKHALNQLQNSGTHSSRSIPGQIYYPSPSRSASSHPHRHGSSRSSPRSGRSSSSRSTPGRLYREGSGRSGSSRSVTDVIRSSFHEYVREKETREAMQERELLMNRKRTHPGMFR